MPLALLFLFLTATTLIVAPQTSAVMTGCGGLLAACFYANNRFASVANSAVFSLRPRKCTTSNPFGSVLTYGWTPAISRRFASRATARTRPAHGTVHGLVDAPWLQGPRAARYNPLLGACANEHTCSTVLHLFITFLLIAVCMTLGMAFALVCG